jgi:hypothetical protein
LQLAFGIAPQELWQQIIDLPQAIQQVFSKWGDGFVKIGRR